VTVPFNVYVVVCPPGDGELGADGDDEPHAIETASVAAASILRMLKPWIFRL
jgi:hypothetical protein